MPHARANCSITSLLVTWQSIRALVKKMGKRKISMGVAPLKTEDIFSQTKDWRNVWQGQIEAKSLRIVLYVHVYRELHNSLTNFVLVLMKTLLTQHEAGLSQAMWGTLHVFPNSSGFHGLSPRHIFTSYGADNQADFKYNTSENPFTNTQKNLPLCILIY